MWKHALDEKLRAPSLFEHFVDSLFLATSFRSCRGPSKEITPFGPSELDCTAESVFLKGKKMLSHYTTIAPGYIRGAFLPAAAGRRQKQSKATPKHGEVHPRVRWKGQEGRGHLGQGPKVQVARKEGSWRRDREHRGLQASE